MKDFQKLIQQKYGTKSGIKKKIEKYSKQESIIVKVLTIINDNENQYMFKEEDEDIQNKFEKI
jgi:hypothetical protein